IETMSPGHVTVLNKSGLPRSFGHRLMMNSLDEFRAEQGHYSHRDEVRRKEGKHHCKCECRKEESAHAVKEGDREKDDGGRECGGENRQRHFLSAPLGRDFRTLAELHVAEDV